MTHIKPDGSEMVSVYTLKERDNQECGDSSLIRIKKFWFSSGLVLL